MISPEALASLLVGRRFDGAGEAACRDSVATHLAARLPMGCALARDVVILPEAPRPQMMVDGRFVVEVWRRGAGRGRAPLNARMMALAELGDVEALFGVTDIPLGVPRAPHWRLIGPGKMFFWIRLPSAGGGEA